MQDLTKEQEERICYIIGEWYLKIKNQFSDCSCGEKAHRLGYLKEVLKGCICSSENYYITDFSSIKKPKPWQWKLAAWILSL